MWQTVKSVLFLMINWKVSFYHFLGWGDPVSVCVIGRTGGGEEFC